MKGRKKKIKDKCGQTFKIWLYQEFHLHFVASTNPPQFLARDFLSLKTCEDAGKQLQCISRNRLQNEDKASGKTWRPGCKMEPKPQTMKDHCGHHSDAETGCSTIWGVMEGGPPCPVGQRSRWERQAKGILCQGMLKAFRTESTQKSQNPLWMQFTPPL